MNAKSKDFGNKMRSANFKMGSILPEHNNYKLSGLERDNSGSLGLTKTASNFRPQK